MKQTFTIIVAVGLLLWWQSCCLSKQHQEIHEVLGYIVEEGHATRKALAELPEIHAQDCLTSRTYPLDVETGEVMPFVDGDLTLDEKGRWIIFSTTLGGQWWRLVPVEGD